MKFFVTLISLILTLLDCLTRLCSDCLTSQIDDDLIKYIMSFDLIFTTGLTLEYDLKQQSAVSVNKLKI